MFRPLFVGQRIYIALILNYNSAGNWCHLFGSEGEAWTYEWISVYGYWYCWKVPE